MATKTYRRDIDGLRAIAVLAVIANHFAETFLPGGYLGVDIFFVISGFVITRSLIDRTPTGLGHFLMAFYARRAKRLLPALIVCVVVTSLAISLVNPDPGGTLRAGAFALFGLSNYAMLQAGADYFSPSADLNGLLHTWSLGVEEQFYFVFPLFGWIVLFRYPTKRRRLGFLALIAVAAGLSFYAWYEAVNTAPMRAFFLSHLRFWELAVGCILAVLMQRADKVTDGARWPVQALSLAAMGALLVVPASFEAIATPAIVLATALAIWAGHTGRGMDQVLTARAAVWIGAISYSLYLWHWPVIVLSRWTIGIHWWSWPLQLAAIFALAQLSYSYIEDPLRRLRWTSRPWSDFALGMTGAGVAAALVLVLAFPLYGSLFVGQRANLAERDAESLVQDYAVPGTNGVWRGAECVLRSNAETGKQIAPARCTLGDPASARRRVLVVGNSHAAAYVHGFDRLVRDDSYAVTITSSFGGAPLPGRPVNPAWRSSSDYYWNSLVPRLASGLRPGDVMLVISDMAWLSPGPWEHGERATDSVDVRKALESLEGSLARSGVSLAVLDGVPFVRDAGCTPDATMPQWFRMGANPCTFYTRAETQLRRRSIQTTFKDFAAGGKMTLIDVFDVFCPGPVCTYRAGDGRILYRDEHSHPSLEAMGLVAPVIRQSLRAIPVEVGAAPRSR